MLFLAVEIRRVGFDGSCRCAAIPPGECVGIIRVLRFGRRFIGCGFRFALVIVLAFEFRSVAVQPDYRALSDRRLIGFDCNRSVNQLKLNFLVGSIIGRFLSIGDVDLRCSRCAVFYPELQSTRYGTSVILCAAAPYHWIGSYVQRASECYSRKVPFGLINQFQFVGVVLNKKLKTGNARITFKFHRHVKFIARINCLVLNNNFLSFGCQKAHNGRFGKGLKFCGFSLQRHIPLSDILQNTGSVTRRDFSVPIDISGGSDDFHIPFGNVLGDTGSVTRCDFPISVGISVHNTLNGNRSAYQFKRNLFIRSVIWRFLAIGNLDSRAFGSIVFYFECQSSRY